MSGGEVIGIFKNLGKVSSPTSLMTLRLYQSWEHETRKLRVSCISIQTREPQVETRKKHEKSQNTKQTRKVEKFTYTEYS